MWLTIINTVLNSRSVLLACEIWPDFRQILLNCDQGEEMHWLAYSRSLLCPWNGVEHTDRVGEEWDFRGKLYGYLKWSENMLTAEGADACWISWGFHHIKFLYSSKLIGLPSSWQVDWLSHIIVLWIKHEILYYQLWNFQKLTWERACADLGPLDRAEQAHI